MPSRTPRVRRAGLATAVVTTLALLVEIFMISGSVHAAPPVYVVAGDDPAATGDQWGLHESYYSDLRATLADPANFGASGKVQAIYTIGAPRTLPLTSTSLDGIDVYFVAARDIAASEVPVLQAFIRRGGSLVINSNGPGFFDTTAWLGFTLSTRLIYGDGPAPYDTTHQAPSPSKVVAAQVAHPVVAGPFGSVATFENWHSVAGFTTVPTGATVLARTTLTGPYGSGPKVATITDVATLAVFPVGAFGAGSGPVVVTSDVDTYSNAYTTALGYPTDARCTLVGTTNGTLARDTFAWIAAQKALLPPPTTTTASSTTSTTSTSSTTTIRRRRK